VIAGSSTFSSIASQFTTSSRRLPKTEVLIFTIHTDEMLISDMLGAGARGYIVKTDLTGNLLEAINSLALHKPFFTAKVSETLLESYLAGGAMTLSERERSLVQMIAEGHTNNQMAKVFNTGKSSIEKQRDVLMRELGLTSWAGIVRYAVRNGLVEP
jgi:DNA-binding NarL/FixJ family response regulator